MTTLQDFYAANPDRARSGEADYGVWWTAGQRWPHYRVSYIRATGEVYAVSMDDDKVEVLGVVPADDVGIYDKYYTTLDRILEGWTDHISDSNGLQWIRERLAAWSHSKRLQPTS